ncbi:Eukaryotic translation initiation factor 4E type 2 [Trichoplax sp. H2]|nr:Eukaryotic translation initiation factor 4E type 2 [Trichoplax sp. H2]|eukprot:RDD46678.1 Eukaryotic translation initiation factor 4E type 2 [Trichoplax sp. H2]
MNKNAFEVLSPDAEDSGDEESKALSDATVAVGEHALNSKFTFWFSRRPPGKQQTPVNYEENIKPVGTVASASEGHCFIFNGDLQKLCNVEQFWNYYSHMARPGDLTGHSDIHLFKDGIKPIWEDEANREGGKWIIRLRKGLASRYWENLILAMIGEQFAVGNEICGAVVSIRFQEDILSLWNRSATEQLVTARIRDTLKRVLGLPANTILEYKSHNDSLKDNSSYRNTDVFVK